jgi:4-diphosphocytidyl-2-C-methyl-D-erythritol kinase
VVGRRSDGYHELESVFVPLDLADEVVIDAEEAAAARVGLELGGETEGIPADAENLALRAGQRFLEAAGLRLALHIRLAKRIPAAAGLGGGSSDAGAVLHGLSELFPGALDQAALLRMAVSLGADVPFFLDPRPALVRGIGERCEPLPGPWPARVLVLANPGVRLSTAQVYQAFDALAPAGACRELRSLLETVRGAPADGRALGDLLENDLEPAAVRLCPPIARLRELLRQAGALAVGMSGSGPTVFGVFGSEREAEVALGRLRAAAWARVARTRESR